MVNFSLIDNKTRERITSLDASRSLPDDVSMKIWGPVLAESRGYTMLTRMLNGTHNRSISSIALSRFSEESPEFLAFLVLIFNKTTSLKVSDSLSGIGTFSCLMATLYHTDSIRILDISQAMLTTEQSKLLFSGVAASPCLHEFRLKTNFENGQESADHVIQAVRQNQSLNVLKVSFHSSFLPNILKEVARKQGLRVFCNASTGNNSHLAVDALQDALCQSDCKLEQLDLVGTAPTAEHWSRCVGVLIQNTSVHTLRLTVAKTPQMNIYDVQKAVKLFKSLVTLDLSYNQISNLSCLDSRLIGEGNNPSLLQSLLLNCNRIDRSSIQKFSHKLPRMKSLRNLELSGNPFLCESPQGYYILKHYLWKNTSLERLRPVLEEHRSERWSEYVTALNRAGRGPITSLAADTSAPAGLWSLILQRAATIKYYSGSDKWGEPTNTTLRADTTFWILREMMTNVLG